MKLPTEKLHAYLALIVVTVLWGLTFPLIRGAVQDIPPLYFLAVRFGLATLVFAPFILSSKLLREKTVEHLLMGIGLGALTWGIFYLQTVGLQTIASPRAAFLTEVSVLLVPLYSQVFQAQKPSRFDWVNAVLALVGLYLLIEPGTEGVSMGDIYVLGCAAILALHIYLFQFTRRVSCPPPVLAFLQIVSVFVISVVTLPLLPSESVVWSGRAIAGVGICGVVVTVGTFSLQARYQTVISAERAALVFGLEPLWASFFAYLILNEYLSYQAFVGGMILLLAVALSILVEGKPKDRPMTNW